MLQKANSTKEPKKSVQILHAPSMRYPSKIQSHSISFRRRKSPVPPSRRTRCLECSGQPFTRYFQNRLHRSCTHCTEHYHVLQKEQCHARWENFLICMQTRPTKRHLISAHRPTCPHQTSTNNITRKSRDTVTWPSSLSLPTQNIRVSILTLRPRTSMPVTLQKDFHFQTWPTPHAHSRTPLQRACDSFM